MISIDEKQFLMDIAIRASMRSKAIRSKVGGVVTDSKGNFVTAGYNGSIKKSLEPLEHKIYHKDEEANSFSCRVDKILYPYSDGIHPHLEHYRLVTNESVVIHAEQNLISHAARRGISIDGGLVFLTLSPCTKCTSLLIQCGIQEIYYLEKYRKHPEVEKLYGNYVKLTHWKNNG